jgi:4-alpha-glucanotransferase
MTDDTDGLDTLAHEAGVMATWRDAHRRDHAVSPDTLRAVLARLRLPADSTAQVRESLQYLRETSRAVPPLLVARAGVAADVPVTGRVRVTLEDGGVREATGAVPVIHVPGYHRLETAHGEHCLAVAPTAAAKLPAGRPWGIAVQLYALRRQGDGGIGDFPALAAFAQAAASHGADAVAISPVHAQFAADPERFSPYSPSSRIMLNALHAAADTGDAAMESLTLVDWPAAGRARMAQFRRAFARDREDAALRQFRAEGGDALEAHARFEVLQAHLLGQDPALWSWRAWPAAFRDPQAPAVAAFAADHADDIAFYAWLQMQAARGLQQAQDAARRAGMRIGLVSDLAVGTDGSGSHAWSRQAETLIGLSVGAPPDLLSRDGQDWGLTVFSPHGLRAHGYGAFLEMLRAALRHAGGVRIDHAMGLQRLWVIPEGARAAEGAYLRFPLDDLLGLIALESQRHGAVVLGEDLGTVAEGFQARLEENGVLGMRVLWFERDDTGFRPPATWSTRAAALTTTHDLPTVAGWWCGHDLRLRVAHDLARDPQEEQAERERDRTALWQAMRDSGAAEGAAPAPDDPARVVDAAVAHVAGSACGLALIPIEDILGRVEQPNLPGTIDQHPNWRRRFDGPAASLLDAPDAARRVAAIRGARA